MQGSGYNETAWKFPGYFPSGENRILPTFYDKFGRDAKPRTLPHPDEVRTQVQPRGSQGRLGVNVFVSSNGIAVKWGPEVTALEAISMITINTYIGKDCPIPKVYGWFVEALSDKESESQTPPCTFIYMEHLRGQTFAERQSTLKPQEIKYITRQLCKAINALRSLNPAGAPFIGGIDHKALPEVMLAQHWKDVSPEAGPFSSVTAFHDWIASIARVRFSLPPDTPIQKREELPNDESPIVFTHGNLNPDNIMITAPGDGPARLASIVNWSQAGFYPAYWEFWKARILARKSEERNQWVEDVMPEITAPFSAPQPALDFFYNIAVRTSIQKST